MINPYNAWNVIKIARRTTRLRSKKLINKILTNQVYLRGDRISGDDSSVLVCLGLLSNISVIIIAHDKGTTVDERRVANFGMTKPHGFKKIMRAINLANRYKIPIISIIDTPGADASVESEKRGQAWAISECIDSFVHVSVPTCSLILSEACSGGGVVLAAADFLLMMENAYFSVISPEGCSSILSKDTTDYKKMAEQLRCTSFDLHKLKIIDSVIEENDDIDLKKSETISRIKDELEKAVKVLIKNKYRSLNDRIKRCEFIKKSTTISY